MQVDPLGGAGQQVKEQDKWARYQLSRGKRDKIRKGDVVGFLANQAGLTADEIGTITIFDQYAIVDLPLRAYEQLMEQAQPLKIKGKTIKVRKYQIEEQARRANSIKKLLKDRPRSS